jgi:hypothetical protein
MATIDEKFVTRLDAFTHSLEGIVELLKEDVKKRNTDNVNEMLAGMKDDITGIVRNLETVVQSIGRLETTTNQILEEVRAARREKEAGAFEAIAEVDNKKKIIEATKIIILIAAGVLAIGLAFKIIGKVDFLSVVALGLGIVFVAAAFVTVASLVMGGDVTWKDAYVVSQIMVVMALGMMVTSWALALAATLTLGQVASIIFVATAMSVSLFLMYHAVKEAELEAKDYPKFLMLPLVLPIIALGIAVSSIILANIVPLTFGQVITTIFVATAIGTSLYIISKALENAKMEKKNIGQFLLLPIIVPAIALGIVISSWILAAVKPISFMQALSTIFVAVTLGVLVYLMRPLIDKMKDLSLKEIGMTTLMIVAIAAGLVLASRVLTLMSFFTFKESMQLIMTSLAIGLAVLFIAPAFYLLKSVSRDDMIKAGINIVIAATTIMISSWLLSMGNYDDFPDWKWSLGTGLAILEFVGIVWLINKMNLNPMQMIIGGVAILGISAIILATSWILSFGNYDEYPSLGWAIGVGLSLIAFGGGMMLLGSILTASGGTVAIAMAVGAIAVLGVAAVIMATSLILGLGDYDEYPGFGWAMGVGLSLVTFGTGMMVLGVIMIGSGGTAAGAMAIGALVTLGVATVIAAVSWILSLGNYESYPTVGWAAGVGLSLVVFGGALLTLGILLPTLPIMLLGVITAVTIASVIVLISNILGMGDYDGGPDIPWAIGTGILLTVVGATMLTLGGFIGATLGLGLVALAVGGFAMLLVASTIVAVSIILSEGNYNGGPTEEWAKASGSILKTVAMTSIFMGMTMPLVLLGLFGMYAVANAIKDVSNILGEGDYTGGPTPAWAKGVGLSIKAFAEGILAMQKSDRFFGSLFGQNQGNKIEEIANAMVLANQLLSSVSWSDNYPKVGWAKGVGGAIMAFAKALVLLEDSDMSASDFVSGVKKLSKGIIAAAEILNEFDWNGIKNYPTVAWSQGVGKAIMAFAGPLAKLAEYNITGTDITRGIKKLAKGLVDAAEIIGEYDWGKATSYPSTEWANGVGRAIGTFVKYLVTIEKQDIGRGDIKILRKTIEAMIEAAEDFSETPGIWDVYPGSQWADGVGKSIGTFVKYLVKIEKEDIGSGDIKKLRKIIASMIEAAQDFTDNPEIWTTYPSSEWAEGVEKSIGAFTKAIKMLTDADEDNFHLLASAGNSLISFAIRIAVLNQFKDLFAPGGIIDMFANSMKTLVDSLPTEDNVKGLTTLGEALNGISTMGLTSSFSIYMLSKAMTELGESLKEIDFDSIDKLSKFSNGILVLSLIDDKKLQDTLKMLEKNKNELSSILSVNPKEGTTSKPPAGNVETRVPSPFETTQPQSNDEARDKFYEELMGYIKSLDSNVLKIAEKEPSDDTSDDTNFSTGKVTEEKKGK